MYNNVEFDQIWKIKILRGRWRCWLFFITIVYNVRWSQNFEDFELYINYIKARVPNETKLVWKYIQKGKNEEIPEFSVCFTVVNQMKLMELFSKVESSYWKYFPLFLFSTHNILKACTFWKQYQWRPLVYNFKYFSYFASLSCYFYTLTSTFYLCSLDNYSNNDTLLCLSDACLFLAFLLPTYHLRQLLIYLITQLLKKH